MKFWTAIVLGLTGLQVALAADQAKPFSCKYNDDDGEATRLYKRVESNASDWYSRYKAIQFCKRANGQGSYVLIEEELIHGFKVLNPARAILSSKAEPEGVTSYHIADDIDQVVLQVSADESLMNALGSWNEKKYSAKLKLVWSK